MSWSQASLVLHDNFPYLATCGSVASIYEHLSSLWLLRIWYLTPQALCLSLHPEVPARVKQEMPSPRKLALGTVTGLNTLQLSSVHGYVEHIICFLFWFSSRFIKHMHANERYWVHAKSHISWFYKTTDAIYTCACIQLVYVLKSTWLDSVHVIWRAHFVFNWASGIEFFILTTNTGWDHPSCYLVDYAMHVRRSSSTNG